MDSAEARPPPGAPRHVQSGKPPIQGWGPHTSPTPGWTQSCRLCLVRVGATGQWLASKRPEETCEPHPCQSGTSKDAPEGGGCWDKHGAAWDSISRGSGRDTPAPPGPSGRPPTATPGHPRPTPRVASGTSWECTGAFSQLVAPETMMEGWWLGLWGLQPRPEGGLGASGCSGRSRPHAGAGDAVAQLGQWGCAPPGSPKKSLSRLHSRQRLPTSFPPTVPLHRHLLAPQIWGGCQQRRVTTTRPCCRYPGPKGLACWGRGQTAGQEALRVSLGRPPSASLGAPPCSPRPPSGAGTGAFAGILLDPLTALGAGSSWPHWGLRGRGWHISGPQERVSSTAPTAHARRRTPASLPTPLLGSLMAFQQGVGLCRPKGAWRLPGQGSHSGVSLGRCVHSGLLTSTGCHSWGQAWPWQPDFHGRGCQIVNWHLRRCSPDLGCPRASASS